MSNARDADELDAMLERAVAAGLMTRTQAREVDALSTQLADRVQSGELTHEQACAIAEGTAAQDALALIERICGELFGPPETPRCTICGHELCFACAAAGLVDCCDQDCLVDDPDQEDGLLKNHQCEADPTAFTIYRINCARGRSC